MSWWWYCAGFMVLLACIPIVFYTPRLPGFALLPCAKCKNEVKWCEDKESECDGEALFKCTKCDHTEHRGGLNSEIVMKSWKELK